MRWKIPQKWVMRSSIVLLVVVALPVVLVNISNYRLHTAIDRTGKPEQVIRYEHIQQSLQARQSSPEGTAAPAMDAGGLDDTFPSLEARFLAFETQFERIQDREARDHQKFWEAFDQWNRKPFEAWTEEEWRRFVQYFSKHDPLLCEIQALIAKGGPVYPLNFDDGLAMELPHLAKIRNMTRWMGYGAAAQAHQGNYDKAYSYLCSAFECGALLEEEPLLISYLVEKACNGIAFGVMDSAIPVGAFTEAQTASLIAMAQERSARPWGVESVLGENYLFQSFFTSPRDFTKYEISEYLLGRSYEENSPLTSAALIFYQTPFSSPLRQMNYSALLENNMQLYALSQQPQYQIQEQISSLESRIDTLPWYHGIAQIVSTSPNALEAQTREYARYNLLWMGLTLEQYHAQHGIYPTTLATAIPDAPLDPYTGAPYHYSVSGDGFTLYSVGRNLVDDHGQHDLREGDIVWRGSDGPK